MFFLVFAIVLVVFSWFSQWFRALDHQHPVPQALSHTSARINRNSARRSVTGCGVVFSEFSFVSGSGELPAPRLQVDTKSVVSRFIGIVSIGIWADVDMTVMMMVSPEP